MTEHGFSMVELLAATAVTLVVAAGTLGLIHSSQSAFSAQPEAADLQQRLRVLSEALFDDLAMAGAGRLDAHFAPVLPFRRGAVDDDGPGRYRSDVVTLYYLPANGAEATLTADLSPGSRVLEIEAGGPCPQHVSPCGFSAGTDVLLMDETGNFGRFTLTAVSDSPPVLTLDRPADAGVVYAAGSRVAEAVDRTYFLRRDAASNVSQVMVYDGSTNPDLPMVDHIVGLTFEYFGDPQPPQLKTAAGNAAAPRTTYGPRPPGPGQQPTAYPAGENCTFFVDFDTGESAPRLPVLGGGSTLVPLSEADLTDGPWCPDATRANRWDADLLRIRKIIVTIRVEAANEALRGPAGLLFANPGSSRAASVWVPDRELRFEVTPRNLNRSR
jgi:hypothetical protein